MFTYKAHSYITFPPTLYGINICAPLLKFKKTPTNTLYRDADMSLA